MTNAPALPLNVALQLAIVHHKSGRLQDAERIYRTILKGQPNNAEANHGLGLLAGQTGQHAAGLPYLKAALDASSSNEQYALSYADALLATGQAKEAMNILQSAMQRGLDTPAAQALRQRAEAAAPNIPAKGEAPTPVEISQLVALFNAGHYAEMESHARLMVEQDPDSGFAWKALGTSLQVQGKDALPALQKAADLLPYDAEAHNNLGNALQALGQLDGAMASCRRALEIKPDLAEAHNSLGAALQALGQLDDATTSYRRALEIKPDYATAYGNLGGALKTLGKLDDALACYQQQVRLTPGNGEAQHQIASLTGKNTERAPVQYVENVFDGYANKFDTHLLQVLKYDAPEKLVALVTQHSIPPVEKWNVLDLGCGTGLVGSAIAPFARQLVGVDLSTKMLEKAHARNLYQRLEHSELLTMMRGEEASSYDVIIAADVFIYLGKLDEVISEIKRLLCPGGVFAFSIEVFGALSNGEASQGAQQEYQLQNTGRYTHSVNYITRLAFDNGFLPKEMAAAQIRVENEKPVNGYLVLWKS